MPDSTEWNKKYLLENFSPEQIPSDVPAESFTETIDILNTTTNEQRVWIKIRKYRTGVSRYSYHYRKMSETEAERIELIRQVKASNYQAYYAQRDKSRPTIQKDMLVFLWEGNSFIIESFVLDGKNVSVLRCSSTEHKEHEIPDFLKIGEDVTENPRYFSLNIK